MGSLAEYYGWQRPGRRRRVRPVEVDLPADPVTATVVRGHAGSVRVGGRAELPPMALVVLPPEIEAAMDASVAAAPPLSDVDRAWLAALFRPGPLDLPYLT